LVWIEEAAAGKAGETWRYHLGSTRDLRNAVVQHRYYASHVDHRYQILIGYLLKNSTTSLGVRATEH
jgi:hypothetical protein